MSRSSPARRAASAATSTPGTGLSLPSRASSPMAACSASSCGGTWCEAASTARAIGRSNPEPSFRSPAGARLTVIRRSGHSSSALAIPLLTRSFASWHALSGRPTMAKAGTPRWRCASTSTGRASRPTRAWVTARASTSRRYAGKCHVWRTEREGFVPTSSRNTDGAIPQRGGFRSRARRRSQPPPLRPA